METRVSTICLALMVRRRRNIPAPCKSLNNGHVLGNQSLETMVYDRYTLNLFVGYGQWNAKNQDSNSTEQKYTIAKCFYIPNSELSMSTDDSHSTN
jgi:hypothetical protein